MNNYYFITRFNYLRSNPAKDNKASNNTSRKYTLNYNTQLINEFRSVFCLIALAV